MTSEREWRQREIEIHMTGFNLSLKNTTRFLPTPLNHLPSIQSKSDKSFASKKPYKTSGSLARRNDSPKHFSPDGWPVRGQGEDFVWQHNRKKLTGIEKQLEKLHEWRRANGSQYVHFHLVLLKSNLLSSTIHIVTLKSTIDSYVSHPCIIILGEKPKASWELKWDSLKRN